LEKEFMPTEANRSPHGAATAAIKARVLVVDDAHAPGMDGIELSNAARLIDPGGADEVNGVISA
jgi:hypothetical protein